MTEDVAHIVIVSPNAAFSAFAETVLSNWPDIEVHAFANLPELATAAFHPAVVACNYEFDSGFFEGFAAPLWNFRRNGPVATLAIVRKLDGWTRTRCRECGIDEVVVKPISPLHLGLRLAALTAVGVPGPARRTAEILPFPSRRRAGRVAEFQPFSS